MGFMLAGWRGNMPDMCATARGPHGTQTPWSPLFNFFEKQHFEYSEESEKIIMYNFVFYQRAKYELEIPYI
jgi:hypothetical protein